MTLCLINIYYKKIYIVTWENYYSVFYIHEITNIESC